MWCEESYFNQILQICKAKVIQQEDLLGAVGLLIRQILQEEKRDLQVDILIWLQLLDLQLVIWT